MLSPFQRPLLVRSLSIRLMVLLLVVGVQSSFPAKTVQANNTFFLPGDAFFFVRLGDDEIKRIHPENTFELTGSLPRPEVFFCGYAGFRKIRLTMPAATRRALGRAVKELEPQMKPDADGKRRAGVLIYNPDFSLDKRRLCIQYNANWAEQTARFGHSADHVRLEDFVGTPDALMESWRDSGKVEALRVKIPELPKKHRGDYAVPVVADNVQLIVIPDRDYQKYFKRKTGAQICRVTNEGVTRFVAQSYRWKEVAKFPQATP